VGNNGDFAIRTDDPGGVYGPKATGAWPPTPIPGTVDIITSSALDNAFGAVVGSLIRRGVAGWEALPIGSEDQILTVLAGLPTWDALSALIDVVFGNLQGSVLYRAGGSWMALPPGAAGQILASNGPAANPAWAPRTAEFPSGTVMLFQQTLAPTGWTKQITVNDYGLRVVSGAVAVTPGSAFSTVFAQSAVGNHTLTVPEIPAHHHDYAIPVAGPQKPNSGGTAPLDPSFVTASTTDTGGGTAHNHSVNLTLAYVDVIIASKD
jgi:hypothetical protein